MKTALVTTMILLLGLGCGSGTHAPGSSGPGLACGSTADCQMGLTCATEDPGGQCIKTCAPRQDATCYNLNLVCNFEGHCYQRCLVDSDCIRAAEGYKCQDDKPARSVRYCDRVVPGP